MSKINNVTCKLFRVFSCTIFSLHAGSSVYKAQFCTDLYTPRVHVYIILLACVSISFVYLLHPWKVTACLGTVPLSKLNNKQWFKGQVPERTYFKLTINLVV